MDGEEYQHQCRDASPLWEVAARSEKTALKPWGWRMGDTIASVFQKDLKGGIGAVHKASALLPQRSEDEVVRRIRPRE
jgi:hypothetical protein